ncbi:Alpha/Beta hydrolase protein [Umbelopsis sp. PMI_123]|nr:Alpha/Beta hydrolase protein [Umbelopsis sp. PMI_123]
MKKSIISVLCLMATLGLAHKPVVLWHGMGDSCCDPETMGRVAGLIQKAIPGTFVHSVQIGDTPDSDANAGFFGNINEQLEKVCHDLAAIPELEDGFNAIGFSQGGQFLRAYVQRCNKPAVHNLITFGSQHAGVSDIPGCADQPDFRCSLMRSIARRGVYTEYVRKHVIQAQYYKDPKNYDVYLNKNIFLPDVNNEYPLRKNKTYRQNLLSLNKLVLIKFAEDETVRPAESAWFWFYNEEGDLIPLEDQPLYTKDWLGLRELVENGRIDFETCPGPHMRISDEYLIEIVLKYLQSETPLLMQQTPQST